MKSSALAAFAPVPVDMVAAVKQAIDVPYLVAGGIRTPAQAAAIIRAGADWVQIGTAAEKAKNPGAVVASLVKAIKNAGKKKR